MIRKVVLLAAFLVACAGTRPRAIDVASLKGPWFGDGPSFELVIGDDTILYEFDMKEHRYRLAGDVLVIEFDDGVRRERILRLAADEMEWQDETFGDRSTLYRKGVWERSTP